MLSSGLGWGTDKAQTGQLSALLDMVETAGELMFESWKLPSDVLDMEG